MSPTACLIGRENVTSCSHQLLTTVVDRILNLGSKIDRDVYSIIISRKNELILSKVSNPNRGNYNKAVPTDEGFESDIDSASLLSSDGDSIQFTGEKNHETQISDSANSSSASDSSDTEVIIQKTPKFEHFQLDNVVCYTNVRYPKIIGFVVKNNGDLNDFLVFEFSTVQGYDRIRYAYNSLNNSKNISSTLPNQKFNLLQRTDKNGVTHIEISRDNNLVFHHNITSSPSSQPSSIISINTPEVDTQADRNLIFDFKLSSLSKVRSNSHADLLNDVKQNDQIAIKSRSNSHANLLDEKFNRNYINKSWSSSQSDLYNELASSVKEIDGIIRADVDSSESSIDSKKFKTLNVNLHKNDDAILKKVWRSAEDILDTDKLEIPKKPERRRKQKGKAPPPPNVMKGQYVRVNVDPNRINEPSNLSTLPKLATFENSKLDNYNSNWVYVSSQPSSLVVTSSQSASINSFRRNSSAPPPPPPSSSEFRTDSIDSRAFTLNRKLTKDIDFPKWTNSVPRIPKMPRSRSENRYSKNNPYKFVDTTTTNHSFSFMNNYHHTPTRFNNFSTHSLPTVVTNNLSNTSSISNRLFGLSQKLKEFSTNVVNNNQRYLNANDFDTKKRRNSLGDLGFKTTNVVNLSTRYGSGDVASNLKSVIKKNDDRKLKNNNEKKVTFSSFATVQVV